MIYQNVRSSKARTNNLYNVFYVRKKKGARILFGISPIPFDIQAKD